ncbi:MAG: hypothetical protein L6R38_004927 [Xanthoria sp. 2 TBL-2021]|nr:MAG: hypothetical protein L6R38_004927 [Xanthoria sp. 2 TBL-2021]
MGIAPRVIDTMTYYEMWQSASAVAGMCARFGKSGTYRQLAGSNQLLWMQLSDGRALQNGKETSMPNETVVSGER